MHLSIGHLYPETMGLYGDRGNIITLMRRCEWRGIDVTVTALRDGDPVDSAAHDILFFGGGADREQSSVGQDLLTVKADGMRAAVELDVVVLAVCGGYQLLGKYFRTLEGEEIPGLGILDAWTIAGTHRAIGNVVVEALTGLPGQTLVGFENHSGQTFLGDGCKPLARVVQGNGNNGKDRTEGAVYRNVYGSYLHGSLLPKNPWFADHLILQALQRRFGVDVSLTPLDDALEQRAHASVIARVKKLGKLRTGVR
ncbi:MAG: type 1 glutamine amidotransferase [Chloroflexota bacterium]